MFTDVGVEVVTHQGPYQQPMTGSGRKRHNPKSKDATAGNLRACLPTRARSWDRSSRSGSISEGHQSPEDEGESKKKVDWCDPQWKGPVSPTTSTDGAATPESGHGYLASDEDGAPPCVSSFICLIHIRVAEPSLTQ